MKQIPPKQKRRGGEDGYFLRLDSDLTTQVRELARERGVTKRALMEEALRFYLMTDAAARTDSQFAPLVNRLIQDQHQVLGKGLRTLIVRLGHEIIRTQFVLFNFMTNAGISPGKVETWREDGWRYAVRELRTRPPEPEEEPGSGSR